MPTHTWNDLVVEEFRTHGGRLRWSTDSGVQSGRPVPTGLTGLDAPAVILAHHVGARTGVPRVNPLWFRQVGDAFTVFGTGTSTVEVRAREAAESERDQIGRAEIDDVPLFAEIERASGRTIPVVS